MSATAVVAAGVTAEIATDAPAEASTDTAAVLRQPFRCECGHELQVFGRGRHRVYFELSDHAFTDPAMSGACPACHRPLPGKHVA